MEKLFEVIHEDGEMLVINKPAGLVCHPTKAGVYSSLISRVRLHLGAPSRPQMVNRLDRETTGIVFVAKTDETARALRAPLGNPRCPQGILGHRSWARAPRPRND